MKILPLLPLFSMLALPALADDQTAPEKRSGVIPEQYIVQLDLPLTQQLFGLAQVDQVARLLLAPLGGELLQVYESALTGFAARLSESQAGLLATLPGVLAIEPDRWMRADAVQVAPPHNLDRIDQTALPLDSSYRYPDRAGQGTHVYVIDTGLRSSHSEVVMRVGNGRNFAANTMNLLDTRVDPANTQDCDGHGTHVSALAVGNQYGVAKLATVHPVRVLGCDGTGRTSDVIAGVDWVSANHIKPAVANVSLGGGNSPALDTAVRNAIKRGITFVVAAGNDNVDACAGSPNQVAEALLVATATRNDARASYSNFGRCIDLFAPGEAIRSAWRSSDTATSVLNGTSMSAPHVAGAAALYLSARPGATPAEVGSALRDAASRDRLSDVKGSPNLLLNIARLPGAAASGSTGTPAATSNRSTAPCTGCTPYSLTLSAGQQGYAPGSSGFSYTGGTLKGYLTLPPGMSASLALERRVATLFLSRWQTVTSSSASSSGGSLSANVAAGTYRWRIQASSGSGTVSFYGQPR